MITNGVLTIMDIVLVVRVTLVKPNVMRVRWNEHNNPTICL